MSKTPSRPEFPPNTIEDNDPGPAEPIWMGVLKVVGVISIVGGVIVLIWLFVASVVKSHIAHQKVAIAASLECKAENVINARGGWEFQKVTFEGHTYATSANRAFTHLESCPCKKTKAEQ